MYVPPPPPPEPEVEPEVEPEAHIPVPPTLPEHTHTLPELHMGRIKCEACNRIWKWEQSRRRALEEVAASGRPPWYGAWRVQPESYTVPVTEETVAEVLPLEQPGHDDPNHLPWKYVGRCPCPLSHTASCVDVPPRVLTCRPMFGGVRLAGSSS